MSFVGLTTALALLVVALGGGYGGAMGLIRRSVDVPPFTAEGRGTLIVVLLYFGGAVTALIGFLLLFLAKVS